MEAGRCCEDLRADSKTRRAVSRKSDGRIRSSGRGGGGEDEIREEEELIYSRNCWNCYFRERAVDLALPVSLC